MADETTLPHLIATTTVPASTLTPEPTGASSLPPPPPARPRAEELYIEIPPISSSTNPALASALAALVNRVYTTAEADIFLPGYARTTAAEITSLLAAGELAVGYLSPPRSSSTAPEQGEAEPVACVCVKLPTPTHAELGMLAVDARLRSAGRGGQMVRFAERHAAARGREIMKLELLVPTHTQNEGKARVQAWYSRLGYGPPEGRAPTGDFAVDYPALAPLLAGPVEYRVVEETLQ
ncbi:hypothetical protein F4780DRAFT_636009 [Xylariomycetidae sp. FL0641]|nr:hypothetical protein F4780DRAFT_636009 [Xylariomycetidae sp. FL0641]